MSEATSDKLIVEKIKQNKHWHHDIKFIDGEFVEAIVERYQETADEDLLAKIVKNYSIFRGLWAKEFSKYLDNEVEAGEAMHDEIIWLASCKFDRSKSIKGDGKAFNAYVVSCLLNQLKNHRNAKMSHKNHPRIKCPVCNEEVYQIDAKHLNHSYDIQRYKHDFPNHPLVSTDGKTVCPITGDSVKEITESYLNRTVWPDKSKGYYTTADYLAEFGSIIPNGPFLCPVTGLELDSVSALYPATISSGYDQLTFGEEFPEFPGFFDCPISGRKILEATQEYLDEVLKQKATNSRKTVADFVKLFPNATIKAKSVKVKNPYTGEDVDSITPAMLRAARVTIQEHLQRHGDLVLDKWYPTLISCPFTGRKTHMMKRSLLGDVGRNAYDFYMTTSKSPLRAWKVKCAICGDYVDNIWTHLEQSKHSYAKKMSSEDFSSAYPAYPMKAVVSTNAFYESDSGDSVHVSDLLAKKISELDPLEVEDSLLSAAEDEIDIQIARSIRNCKTMDDIFHMATVKKKVPFKMLKFGSVKEAVRSVIGEDFDLVASDDNEAEILMPSRESIKRRLLRLYSNSDLMADVNIV